MSSATTESLPFPILGECSPFPDADQSGRRPSEVIVLEIDFDIVGGNLRFFFSRAWGPTPIDASNTIEKQMAELAKGKFPNHINKMETKSPISSKLSFRNKAYRYIAYVLSPKNWQFSRSYVPMTIQSSLLNYGVYFEARRVTPAGIVQEIGDGTQDLARVAYFVADGEKILNNPGIPGYPHGINFNVELFDTDGTVLPLIIDPDIRYPGGITLVDPE